MSYQHQQQPYQQPPPVKRRGLSTTWIIVIVSVSVAAVLLAAVLLTEPRDDAGGAASSAPAGGTSQTDCGRDKREPCTVRVGQAFTLGKHETLAGWKVVNEYDRFSITGKVKNISDRTSTAFFHVKFLRGNEVLGNVMCNSGDLEPGQVETLNCIPDGAYGPYDRVTAEATF
jgi:hypothetical protein